MLRAAKLNEFITSTGNGVVDAIVLFIIAMFSLLGGGTYLYLSRLKPWLTALKVDTMVIREQTENNHGNAENPNLRDDLDAKHHEITSQLRVITTTLEDLDASQKRVDSEIQRIHVEVGSLRSDVAVERGRINRMMDR